MGTPAEFEAPAWVDRAAWPHPARRVVVEGHGLHHVDVGQGADQPPVVLVHGTPTWSFEWRHVIAHLAPTRRCIAIDHLGFGLSDRPRGADYTPEAHARRFVAAVDALGLDRVDLVVHDFGGPIGLPLALVHRRVRRLVVLNSWMWSFRDDPEMWRSGRVAGSWLGRWLYRWANLSLRAITPSAYGDRRKLTPAIHTQYLAPFVDRDARVEVLWALARALCASSDHYERLWEARGALREVPVTVVWGLADSAFRPNQLVRWREAVPHAAVVEIPGAGHWPHEEAPEIVGPAIAEALRPSG